MSAPSRLIEAVKEEYNLLAMATVVAVSAMTSNPLPLLAGMVAEATYLIFVPDTKWYGARLQARAALKAAQQREARKAAILPQLCGERRERYLRLEGMHQTICSQIATQHEAFHDSSHKFDYLLDKFLEFASKEAQFTQYLSGLHDEVCGTDAQPVPHSDPFARGRVPAPVRSFISSGVTPLDPSGPWVAQAIGDVQATYAKELKELTGLIDKEQDPNTKTVLVKRQEILTRRVEFVGKIAKALENLSHQLQLLADTFGLINDEMRARSPEQVVEDIDDVVTQTDCMTRTLEELAPYEQLESRIAQAQ